MSVSGWSKMYLDTATIITNEVLKFGLEWSVCKNLPFSSHLLKFYRKFGMKIFGTKFKVVQNYSTIVKSAYRYFMGHTGQFHTIWSIIVNDSLMIIHT